RAGLRAQAPASDAPAPIPCGTPDALSPDFPRRAARPARQPALDIEAAEADVGELTLVQRGERADVAAGPPRPANPARQPPQGRRRPGRPGPARTPARGRPRTGADHDRRHGTASRLQRSSAGTLVIRRAAGNYMGGSKMTGAREYRIGV